MSLRSRLALGLAVLTVALGTPVVATAASLEPAARSAVDAPLAPGDPATLTLVVPLTVPPNETGLLDADTLTRYTAPLGLLTRQLDALADAPVAIGLDPLIAASIRVLGTSAPPSALAWLERLRAASNEVFALAYADADVSAAASTGSLGLLAPIGFDFAVDPANFGEAQTASPTPTPSADARRERGPPAPDPRGSARMAVHARRTWPGPPTTPRRRATVEAIGAAGYETVILSSTNVSDPVPTVNLGEVTGVVSDAPLSALLRAATHATSELELQSALDALDAGVTAFADANPGGEIVATLDRHWPFLSYHLAEVIARLSASPAVVFGTLAATIERPAVDATVTDHPEEAGRLSVIGSAVDRGCGREPNSPPCSPILC